jgi:hypothetical protein
LPCMISGARITLPPKAAPIAWCPRQTPQDRYLARKTLDQRDADARFVGRAWPRRGRALAMHSEASSDLVLSEPVAVSPIQFPLCG